MIPTSDLHIVETRPLVPPAVLHAELPISDQGSRTVQQARERIKAILHGGDRRQLVIVGPCSVHDGEAAREYAEAILEAQKRHRDDLEIVMRVYFEKPRTTVGWKGLINDPTLDNSFDINEGLRRARELLLDINRIGLPAGSEFLDMISPQYFADLIAWGAIGARTTESQVHRELASGLSCPVGFKNGTDGNLRIALDAIKAASQPHHFLSVTKGGYSAIVATNGNEDCHVILRGGKQPNYDAASLDAACKEAAAAALACRLMIDCSHGNSQKKPENQVGVASSLAAQIAAGDSRVFGVMVESHLVAGRQDLRPGQPLVYGQSITDGCIGWEESIGVLDTLAEGVRARRVANGD
jgi:3-deoxy-7-phosphoheptulonate synthase